MENRKELIKKFREKVAGGKYADRHTLLAYAFLRGVPYVALERIINEDHPSFGIGREGFLSWLARSVAWKICDVQFPGKSPYELRKEGKEDEAKALSEQIDSLKKSLNTEILNWIHEKYSKSEESAA